MPLIPAWMLKYSGSLFAEVARSCPACAWIWLIFSAAVYVGVTWYYARGTRLKHIAARPNAATASRAVVGFLWLVTLVTVSWVGGVRGLVPLVGDTMFIVFAAITCLEWYAWWSMPVWVGKLAEVAVVTFIWAFGWLIARAIPADVAWPFTIAGFATLAILISYELPLRVPRILIWGLLIPCAFILLLLPGDMRPAVSLQVLWPGISLALCAAAPIMGGLWLKLPESVGNALAPLWFGLAAVLAHLGVPFFNQ